MNSYIDSLIKHPFTSIQLSDKEKFHTGMLKLLLEYSQANLIEHKLFKNNILHKPKCYLEINSVDLLVIQKNYITIIETKFKTGLHSTIYKNNLVSQIQKYASTHKQADEGIVVSLFKENNDLNILEHKISKFKNITFTNEILELLNSINKNESIISTPVFNLLILWKSYLTDLKILVDNFEAKKLNSLNDNGLKDSLHKLKLKGVFQQYRMHLVKDKVDKLINSEEKIKGKLGNTHGNALLCYEITFDKNDFNFEKYGVQWQNGKFKFFIEVKNNSKKSNIRDVALKEIGRSLHGKFFKKDKLPKNVNRSGKFKSFNIAEAEEFSDLNRLPYKIADCLNYLVDSQKFILELTSQNK